MLAFFKSYVTIPISELDKWLKKEKFMPIHVHKIFSQSLRQSSRALKKSEVFAKVAQAIKGRMTPHACTKKLEKGWRQARASGLVVKTPSGTFRGA